MYKICLCFLLVLCVTGSVHAQDESQSITSITEIRNHQDGIGKSVDFSGVVTYTDPVWNFQFVQSGSEAIFVRGVFTQPDIIGQRVKIIGQVAPGDLNPVVHAKSVTPLRADTLPAPIPVDISNLSLGEFDCMYVSVETRCLQIVVGSDSAELYCETGQRHFYIRIARRGSGFSELHTLVGQRIRCNGCLGLRLSHGSFSTIQDRKREILSFKLMCNSPDDIIPLDPANRVPDSTSVSSLRMIRDAPSESVFLTHGQISLVDHHDTKPEIVVFDNTTAVRLRIHSALDLLPGTVLRIRGQRSTNEKGTTSLVANYFEQLNLSSLSHPKTRSFKEAIAHFQPNQRIAIEGRPVRTYKVRGATILELEQDGQIIGVRIRKSAEQSLALVNPALAQRVRVIGVCSADKSANPDVAFQMDVAQPELIELLEQRSGPTKPILLIFTSLLAACVLAILWIKSLQLQVAQKTRSAVEVSAQLRSSYDAIADGVLAMDNEQNVLAVNSEFLEITGYKLQVGDYVGDLARRLKKRLRDSEPLARNLLAAIEHPETDESFQIELDHDQPNPIHVHVHAAPIRTTDWDKPMGRLLVLRNETENRKLQAELQHSNKLDAIGRLVGGVAHDFNNILTVITANIQMSRLVPDAKVSVVDRQLATAQDAAFGGARIIRRLLTFSSKESFALRPHRINDIVHHMRELTSHTFDSTIEFKFEFDPVNPTVSVERTAVEQVLLNLYVNAKDAMPNGGVIRTVTHTRNSANTNQRWAMISVIDSGSGVPPEIQDKIFEPYFTTKGNDHGTGLGLPISYRVIRQHGGQLRYQNRSDGGSEFIIELPLVSAPEVKNKDAHKDVPHGQGTILVVDDEDNVRSAAELMLVHQGYKTIPAKNGSEAIALLEKNKESISAVLLDLSMPGMSGHEVLKEIKRRWADVPVVLCSGYFTDGIQNAAHGAHATVPKPYTAHKLVSTLVDVTSVN